MGQAHQTIWIQSYICFSNTVNRKVTRIDQSENMEPRIGNAKCIHSKSETEKCLKSI
ncbi:hypothetical protein C1H46_008051 [Malus baccata]|uniref:Uncharacterized protein n=1 Tax=Malus baccata TaxID=106549 RepID=A0A540N724_MALBA|nr:hypothetical protein C1H46_008051 [Malus baccata]